MKYKNKTGTRGVFTALLVALMLSNTAFAESEEKANAVNGKKLFDDSECTKCHGTEVYTRKDHKVKDLEGLTKQVKLCDSQLSVNWFDADVSDVVAYLNESFYKFSTEKADKGKEKKKEK